MRLLPGLSPLRHRDFALYWIGQCVSQVGTFIEMTATTYLLYAITSSPLLLGLGGLVRGVPILALALFGGALADRIDRKRLLLFTQCSQVITSIILGTLVATGAVQFWHIYAIGFVTGLPKTRSAKIVRRAVRAAALGDDIGDTSSLEDPAVLAQVADAR